jgi:GT2 family glycosyltransferase
MKIIFFIISIVVSILMVVVSHCGLTRYLQLHRSEIVVIDVENYSKLDKATSKRLVISMAPTKNRLEKLDPVLKSIVDQTVRADMIAINAPYSFKIPKRLESVANVFRTGKNYGEGAKIIPTLFREKDKDTMILILEDDVVYGRDFVENIVNVAIANPGKAIVVEGKAMLIQSPDHADPDLDGKHTILVEQMKIDSSETYKCLY